MSGDVLVIHESTEARSLLAEAVLASGAACRTAGEPEAAMREIARARPDLVLICGSLHGGASSSLATLKQLIALHQPMPVILVGAPKRDDIARRAMIRLIKDAVADAQSQQKVLRRRMRAA